MEIYRGWFPALAAEMGSDLLVAPQVAVPTWHAKDVSDSPMHVSYELENVVMQTGIPGSLELMQKQINPQLPWAEDHFRERVSGKPLNPPPSAEQWHKKGVADVHRTIEEDGELVYSHTYPERIWPRNAAGWTDKEGLRFRYGDLNDLLDLLTREPLTRQAYLPIWFPEDTGAHHRERVPCTLGYHFMIRENHLNITYMIRSVDFVRHFRDDVYLAMRLAWWMCARLWERGANRQETQVGDLTMHIMSLHYFEGDRKKMEKQYG